MTSLAAPEQETHSSEAILTDGCHATGWPRESPRVFCSGLVSARRMELARLDRARPPVLAGDLAGMLAQDLPGRLGRRPGLLAARPPVGPPERRQRLARLDLDGPDLLALVARVSGPRALVGAPPPDPAASWPLRSSGSGGEFLRAYFLTGFPWYYLAHSQFRHSYLIQIADFTGSLGISLLDRRVQRLRGRPCCLAACSR